MKVAKARGHGSGVATAARGDPGERTPSGRRVRRDSQPSGVSTGSAPPKPQWVDLQLDRARPWAGRRWVGA